MHTPQHPSNRRDNRIWQLERTNAQLQDEVEQHRDGGTHASTLRSQLEQQLQAKTIDCMEAEQRANNLQHQLDQQRSAAAAAACLQQKQVQTLQEQLAVLRSTTDQLVAARAESDQLRAQLQAAREDVVRLQSANSKLGERLRRYEAAKQEAEAAAADTAQRRGRAQQQQQQQQQQGSGIMETARLTNQVRVLIAQLKAEQTKVTDLEQQLKDAADAGAATAAAATATAAAAAAAEANTLQQRPLSAAATIGGAASGGGGVGGSGTPFSSGGGSGGSDQHDKNWYKRKCYEYRQLVKQQSKDLELYMRQKQLRDAEVYGMPGAAGGTLALPDRLTQRAPTQAADDDEDRAKNGSGSKSDPEAKAAQPGRRRPQETDEDASARRHSLQPEQPGHLSLEPEPANDPSSSNPRAQPTAAPQPAQVASDSDPSAKRSKQDEELQSQRAGPSRQQLPDPDEEGEEAPHPGTPQDPSPHGSGSKEAALADGAAGGDCGRESGPQSDSVDQPAASPYAPTSQPSPQSTQPPPGYTAAVAVAVAASGPAIAALAAHQFPSAAMSPPASRPSVSGVSLLTAAPPSPRSARPGAAAAAVTAVGATSQKAKRRLASLPDPLSVAPALRQPAAATQPSALHHAPSAPAALQGRTGGTLPRRHHRPQPQQQQQQQQYCGNQQQPQPGSQQQGPGYKYQEVVRGRAARDALPAFDCAECCGVYEAMLSWQTDPDAGGGGFAEEVMRAVRCEDHGGLGAAATGPRAQVEKMLQHVSKHRAKFKGRSTQHDYWDMGFFDSLDSRYIDAMEAFARWEAGEGATQEQPEGGGGGGGGEQGQGQEQGQWHPSQDSF